MQKKGIDYELKGKDEIEGLDADTVQSVSEK